MQLRCNTKALRGNLSYNRAMKKMNSWKVGGASECFYEPVDLDDFSFFLKHCADDYPITCLGMGSNVLIRDEGVRGIVVAMKGIKDEVRHTDTGRVHAGAGTACAKVARYCAKHGLAGLEFLAGVPGTIGGALAMNAGAFGNDIWQYVEEVEIIRRDGQISSHPVCEFITEYRQVQLRGENEEYWFITARFTLAAGNDAQQLQQQIKELLRQRSSLQPIGTANCGSVFKNPPNDYSARLIEACGLKGYMIGDAQVSPKHANFIINRGNASAADIECLIHHVQGVVEKKTGIYLELEVKVIGGDV